MSESPSSGSHSFFVAEQVPAETGCSAAAAVRRPNPGHTSTKTLTQPETHAYKEAHVVNLTFYLFTVFKQSFDCNLS